MYIDPARIFNVTSGNFENLALEIFRFQHQNNPVYKAFADRLIVDPANVKTLCEIPFLPVQFFKSHQVKTTEFEPEAEFESSGTSQTQNSHHFIKDIELYKQSFLKGFNLVYDEPGSWCILGLLPSYLERSHSSLVFMVEELIRQTENSQSGFYLYDHEKLYDTLRSVEGKSQKTILIGVSFALLDFAAKYPLQLKNTIIMETGGMKGRKEEITRYELHERLKSTFQVDAIHSEYGMTELLSQAYAVGNGIFHCPPWMKILIRDEDDPLSILNPDEKNKGVLNIIDLANLYSCSFIATDDAGQRFTDGSFEVLGRIDNSDIRGCSLLAI